jgi:hypothetical protein
MPRIDIMKRGKNITASVIQTIRPNGFVRLKRIKNPRVLCSIKAVIDPISRLFHK